MSGTGNGLGIFLQYPEPGKVLPVLASEIGDDKAADAARLITEKTIEEISRIRDRFDEALLFVNPISRHSEAEEWLGRFFPCLPQIGDTALERLKNSARLFHVKRYPRLIILSADVCNITGATLDAIIGGFKDYDAVLGPKTDGGIYALGIPGGKIEVLESVKTRSEDIFPELKIAFLDAGMRVGILEKKKYPETKNDLPEKI